jgi:hypothetical protein
MSGSAALLKELAERTAITQGEFGFPASMVPATFDNAIRLDPSNERAKRKLTAFEAGSEPIRERTWETRTAGAVRTSSLAERRFAMAA